MNEKQNPIATIQMENGGIIKIEPSTMVNQALGILGQTTQHLVQISTSVAGNLGSFVIGLCLMFFCLFFFYLDGPYLVGLVSHAIPIRKSFMDTIIGKFRDTTRSLFFGYILVAFIQAVIAWVIFTAFHVQSSLVFASLVLICAFIPMVGAALVWLPLGLVRIFTGDIVGGIVFLAVCGPLISLTDNFLRPFFLKDRIKLHPLVIFLAIIGGVKVFGFNGLILGPMLIIIFLTVLDMFLAEHHINRNDAPQNPKPES
jgi:predicted PurR-regulated permease PerM